LRFLLHHALITAEGYADRLAMRDEYRAVQTCELAPAFFERMIKKIMFNEVSEFCLVQGDGGLPTAVAAGEPRGRSWSGHRPHGRPTSDRLQGTASGEVTICQSKPMTPWCDE